MKTYNCYFWRSFRNYGDFLQKQFDNAVRVKIRAKDEPPQNSWYCNQEIVKKCERICSMLEKVTKKRFAFWIDDVFMEYDSFMSDELHVVDFEEYKKLNMKR